MNKTTAWTILLAPFVVLGLLTNKACNDINEQSAKDEQAYKNSVKASDDAKLECVAKYRSVWVQNYQHECSSTSKIRHKIKCCQDGVESCVHIKIKRWCLNDHSQDGEETQKPYDVW